MRYAVFSDVHSNLEALEAVLVFFNKSDVDQYFFCGDIVGYGANPKECIELLRRLNALNVVGNHDWASVGLTDIGYFNRVAKSALLWTQENISENDRLFLSGLELTRRRKKCCLVHGTLNRPQDFDYMIDLARATETFYSLKETVCFVGHSHVPGVFIEEDQGVHYRGPKTFTLGEDQRCIVNVGSVGQPRDGDPRACCCIYDDADNSIEFKRIDYDVVMAAGKITKAGLPKELASRLAIGR